MKPVDALLALVVADPLLSQVLVDSCKTPPDEASVSAWLDLCQERGWPLSSAVLVRDAYAKQLCRPRPMIPPMPEGMGEPLSLDDARRMVEEMRRAARGARGMARWRDRDSTQRFWMGQGGGALSE